MQTGNGGLQCISGLTEMSFMKQHGGAPTEPAPWRPMKAYEVSISGDMSALCKAVTQCQGVLYHYSASSSQVIVVVPAEISPDRIREILNAGGTSTVLNHAEELGPP